MSSSGSGSSSSGAANGGSRSKPKVGATGGKPNFWKDSLIYGVKPWDEGAEEFWHGLNKELAKQEKYEAKKKVSS